MVEVAGLELAGYGMVFIGEFAFVEWHATSAFETHRSQVESRMPGVCDRADMAGSDHY
jgi:hypothetical protein